MKIKSMFCILLFIIIKQTTHAAAPSISGFAPSSGTIGSLVTLSGTDFTNVTTFTIGGKPAVIVSNTGTQLVGMVMPGTVTGPVKLGNADGTATANSTFTIMSAASASHKQAGGKLVGTGGGVQARQGTSIALSADGSTAIVGGSGDAEHKGAVWIYTLQGNVWVQQGPKLVGTGISGTFAYQGHAVAISADGNTALVGGYGDKNLKGAGWVFTRTNGVWTQQGPKLTGIGGTANSTTGYAVALSADGNTAVMGGYGDNNNTGAAWVYTRSFGLWTQKGNKLVGTGGIGNQSQGMAVDISADGKTIIIGGGNDNTSQGAVWFFNLVNGTWQQKGSKYVVTDNIGAAQFGWSVALSADGTKAIAGGFEDNDHKGAAWILSLNANTWTTSAKLTATGSTTNARLGATVGLNANGDVAIIGAPWNNTEKGAAFIFRLKSGAWVQDSGSPLIGTGSEGNAFQGSAVAISADGRAAMTGAFGNKNAEGAAWAFVSVQKQVLIFASFGEVTYGSKPLTPNITSTNGTLPVKLSSSDTSVAKIIGDKISIVGAGASTITATQPGNLFFTAAAPVTQLLTVNKATLTVSAANGAGVSGLPLPPVPINYKGFVNNEGVQHLTKATVLTFTFTRSSPPGTYQAIPSGAESPDYTFVYNPGKITLVSLNSVKAPIAKIYGDADFWLYGQTAPASLIFTSGNHAVATISSSGYVTIKGVGKTIITTTTQGHSISRVLTVSAAGSSSLEPMVSQALSPNGDGSNDVLTINNIEKFTDNKLVILSSRGTKVFEASGYDNISRAFNGYSNITSSNLQPGIYFYRLQYRDEDVIKNKSGYFVLKY